MVLPCLLQPPSLRRFFKQFHTVTLWIFLSLTYYNLNPSPNGSCSRNLFSPLINSHLAVLAWSYLQAIYTRLYYYQSSFILSSSFPLCSASRFAYEYQPLCLYFGRLISLLASFVTRGFLSSQWQVSDRFMSALILPDRSSRFVFQLCLTTNISSLHGKYLSWRSANYICSFLFFFFFFFPLLIEQVIQGPRQEHKTKQSIYRTL